MSTTLGVEEDVLVHKAEFRGAAKEFMAYRGSEVILEGPAGTGKSRVCLTKIHLACLMTPGVKALIVRKTAVSLTASSLATYREKVAKEAIAAGAVVWYGGSQQEPAGYRYENGSIINVGGMDNPDKVLSTEYDLIFVDESTEVTEKDWNTLMTRLRNGRISFQQIMGACNPSGPTHWLLVRAKSTLRMLHSRHQDNPAYFSRDGVPTQAGLAYLEMLKSLTGLQRLRLFEGKWAAAEGIIYESYDPALHVVPRFPIPEDWPRYWAVDFGFVHPFVLQMWAKDPDGRLFMYREIHMSKRLVEDHAKTALAQVRTRDEKTDRWVWNEPKPRAILTDHQAEDRATLEKHLGMATKPAKKTVSDGIQAVESRLKLQGDGKPRLFILEDSIVEVDRELQGEGKPTCLADEIPSYVWGNSKTKEAPLKENDDGCDTMRYVVAEIDLVGGARADRHF
jgi:phage terminase large subunit